MFPDGRANRGEIAGTVARGWLKADEPFYRGLDRDGAEWTTGFPKAPDGTLDDQRRRSLERGQNRFNIYCTPCHGYDGRGMGMVPSASRPAAARGRRATWSRRPAMAGRRGRQMPNGQLFNTISNGYNTMMGYAAQIPHADRWAIVALRPRARSARRTRRASTTSRLTRAERSDSMSALTKYLHPDEKIKAGKLGRA